MFDEGWQPLGLGGSTCASDHGFSWGYLDVLDAAHTGVVVIWSFGQPFLPGTVGASRSGRPVRPVDEPSVSIAVHREGRNDLWMLQRLAPTAAEAEPFPEGGLELDGCRFHHQPGVLEVALDCPVPGGPRLTGTIRVEGPPVQIEVQGDSLHRWAPRILGTGTADLRCGEWELQVEGAGYHDANASSVSLEKLGIHSWTWGRTPHPDGTWIHYFIEPLEAGLDPFLLWLDIDHRGQVRNRFVTVEPLDVRRGRWGLKSARHLRVGDGPFHDIRHVRSLEDGPYYQRWVTEVTDPEGRVHTGTGEFVDVTKMDAGVFSWLTPFAVHDARREGWWSPLFCGPVQGRWSRLLRHWLS